MLTLPLDPTDDKADPIFKDAAGCAAWLAQFQLTNVQRAHALLLSQLNELNRYPMIGLERYHTIEILRETVAYLQEDMAKKLIGKALPLGEHELMIFLTITHLWQAMMVGYQRCLQAYAAGDKKLANLGAMLCERCLQYTGAAIFEHLRTGYECNPRFWYQLHHLYAYTEAQNFQDVEVEDTLSQQARSGTGRNMYVKMLLSCYARPAELSRSQLKLLDRWLNLWSKEVRVEKRCVLSKGDAQPLAIDMGSTSGLHPVAECRPNPHTRFLAMVPLSKLLRVKIILLQQGASMEQVGLGELPGNSAGIQLLSFLHQCWCEDYQERIMPRDQSGVPVQFCYTPGMIHAHMKGKAVAHHPHAMDDLKRKQIETLGRVSTTAADAGSVAGEAQEGWMLDDESAMGAKLTRSAEAHGRLSRHQLVSVRRSADQPFKLGAVAWLHVSVQGLLQLGVSYLPGTPEPVQVMTGGGSAQAGFLLPEVAALRSPASLIVPRDLFRAGGMLEIVHVSGAKEQVKMGISVTRGYDYERISFTAM